MHGALPISASRYGQGLQSLLNLASTLRGFPRIPGSGPSPATVCAAAGPLVINAWRLADSRTGPDPQGPEPDAAETEAERLLAQGQEVFSRHALDQVLQRLGTHEALPVACRRIRLEAPYLPAKLPLLRTLTDANGCRLVHTSGASAVVGTAADVAAVLALWQALAALAQHGLNRRHATPQLETRVRERFLAGLAVRIETFLQAAAERGRAEVDPSLAAAALHERDEAAAAAETSMTFGERVRVLGEQHRF